MAVTLTIWWPRKASTHETFPSARHARRALLTEAKSAGARIEGNGIEGSLIAGQGSSKRTLACYEMKEEVK